MKAKDVFISYSQKDSYVVDNVLRTLEEENISYYIDKDAIVGGELVVEILAELIDCCHVLLFFGSNNSYQSKWAMKEVSYAFREKKGQNILPVIIDPTPLPNSLKFLFHVSLRNGTTILLIMKIIN